MATTKVPTIKDEIFRQELDALCLENFRSMYRTAKCVTGNRHDAEEAIENVFVRFFEGQPSRVFRKNPKAYLCKAAINEARNIVRSNRLRKWADPDVSELEIATHNGDERRTGFQGKVRLEDLAGICFLEGIPPTAVNRCPGEANIRDRKSAPSCGPRFSKIRSARLYHDRATV